MPKKPADTTTPDPEVEAAGPFAEPTEAAETVVLDEPVIVDEPAPEPEPELVVREGGPIPVTPVLETPLLFGFEEEPPKESNILLDEPDPAPAEQPITGVGAFVAFGVEQVSRADGEWLVDPDTGCITGPAA